ncbi:MAG: 3D-(3,5/4)-trihydroxycyclohexane-1,2-dione acylhydrolase (decyclizing) [Spirochaetales bacterium]|uniref:3D-(3,5/4)-trihydroxycyclohexane-1,2-dione acylhydrolase (Decyclizing) n=1 Tax=Candidatus Thalassospirochaeta sargassi TaxID=3119039 RepID=A0AAJ1MMB0_9SPIO|nr:3D-(3,5/4)-trihydroxycyclohexane-1,2-dione acylhydrolase (decyclizing) [Spirochaetales bacterium]
METVRLTMSQALVKFLDNQYLNFDGEEIKFVEGVIGIFGHGIVVGLGEALEDKSHSLKFIQGKSEQGMAHIAMGFAKQKKRRQIMAVTSSIGPGALNMVTAAGTATANRIPVLFLPADSYGNRQPDPVLQQIENSFDHNITANDAFKPVSKYWDRIARPEQLMSAMINAMRVLTSPADTGAVTICLPQDVQGEAYDYPVEFFEKRVHFNQRRCLDEAALSRLAARISQAKKPFIICGGGVKYSEAGDALNTFCTEFSIPFGETQAGKSTLPADNEFNLGGAGVTGTLSANRIAKDADLIIGIGTRLNDFCTSSKSAYRYDVEMVTINVNDMDAYKMNAAPFFADAKLALQQLTVELKKQGYKSAYKTEYADAKAEWAKELDRLFSIEKADGLAQSTVLGVLSRDLVEKDSIVVSASGSLPSDCQRVWNTNSHNAYHAEYAFSCMGYEVAGAIGAKLAEPEREVYVMVGDGGFLMLHTELVTALQEGIKINIVLLDNSGFQCIHNLQRSQGIPSFANEFRYRESDTDRLTGDTLPINFAKLAEAYGAKGFEAKSVEELKSLFPELKKSKTLNLIDVKVLPGTMTEGYEAWWRVGTAQVSSHPEVEKAAEKIAEKSSQIKQF